MQRSGFQYCCGAEEIGSFGISYLDNKAYIAQVLASEKAGREQDLKYGEDHEGPGAFVATTTEDQTGAIRALKFHKFKKALVFTNPGTGNKVTLWAKKLVK